MLDRDRVRVRFHEATSEWARSFSLASIKCLIVCRGPVRKEAIDVFDEVGIAEPMRERLLQSFFKTADFMRNQPG